MLIKKLIFYLKNRDAVMWGSTPVNEWLLLEIPDYIISMIAALAGLHVDR